MKIDGRIWPLEKSTDVHGLKAESPWPSLPKRNSVESRHITPSPSTAQRITMLCFALNTAANSNGCCYATRTTIWANSNAFDASLECSFKRTYKSPKWCNTREERCCRMNNSGGNTCDSSPPPSYPQRPSPTYASALIYTTASPHLNQKVHKLNSTGIYPSISVGRCHHPAMAEHPRYCAHDGRLRVDVEKVP